MLTGKSMISKFGKKQIALSMYAKGKAFITAAMLLKKQAGSEPFEYVVLHLICQGIELVLKGLLLIHDYDKYEAQLRKIGHDLVKAARKVTSAYGVSDMPGEIEIELRKLSELYSWHYLRYGVAHDVFIAPLSILRERVVRRLLALIRLSERELRRA